MGFFAYAHCRLSSGRSCDTNHLSLAFWKELRVSEPAEPRSHERKISLDQVRHVGKLSRLALSEQQAERFAGQLETILEYVAKINQVDMGGVEPMAHPTAQANVLREDAVEPALPLEQVLRNAPDTDGPFFKVPKIIGGDEDSAG